MTRHPPSSAPARPKMTHRNPGEQPSAESAVDKKISMREVARLAKVSVATVSMVLNDNPRISRATHMRCRRTGVCSSVPFLGVPADCARATGGRSRHGSVDRSDASVTAGGRG